MADLTTEILLEIRDEIRSTNARLDKTNARLDDTVSRLDDTVSRLDDTVGAARSARCDARPKRKFASAPSSSP